jgi:hypothetical protein
MSNENTTVQLETPIQRGEKTISEIQLRKPNGGDLRGLSLVSLMQMETDSIIKVLPRISMPTLTENDVIHMAIGDLSQIGIVLSGFLLPKNLLQPDGEAE